MAVCSPSIQILSATFVVISLISMKLSVVIPIYNETGTLEVLYERLMAVLPKKVARYEIILVDDGSSDDSLDQIQHMANRNHNVKWIHFSRNFGHQAAISAGLSSATGDAVVTMDGDLQDPPELIPKLLDKWESGAEVVYARRSSRKGELWIKLVAAYLFYRLLNRITAVDIPADVGDFRLIDKKVLESLIEMPEPHHFLRGQIAWLGFSSDFVDFERAERYAGHSKYSLWKLLQLAFHGVWGYSKFPVTLLWILGGGFFALTLVFFIWGGIQNFPAYWPKWACLGSFLVSMHAVTMALIGEYIYRIYDGVRNRPAYIIKDSNL